MTEERLIRELSDQYPSLHTHRIRRVVNEWGTRTQTTSEQFGIGGLLALENFPNASTAWLGRNDNAFSKLSRFVQQCGESAWSQSTSKAWESPLMEMVLAGQLEVTPERTTLRNRTVCVESPHDFPASIAARSSVELEAIRRLGEAASRALLVAQCSKVRHPELVAKTFLQLGHRLVHTVIQTGPAIALALTNDHRTKWQSSEIFHRGLENTLLRSNWVESLIASNHSSIERALEMGFDRDSLVRGVQRISRMPSLQREWLARQSWSVVTCSIEYHGAAIGQMLTERSPGKPPLILLGYPEPESRHLLGLLFLIAAELGEVGWFVLLTYARNNSFLQLLERVYECQLTDAQLRSLTDFIYAQGEPGIHRLLLAPSIIAHLDWELNKETSFLLPTNLMRALHAIASGAYVAPSEIAWSIVEDIGVAGIWIFAGMTASASPTIAKTFQHIGRSTLVRIAPTSIIPTIEASLASTIHAVDWLDNLLAPVSLAGSVLPIDAPSNLHPQLSNIFNNPTGEEQSYHDLGKWLLGQRSA